MGVMTLTDVGAMDFLSRITNGVLPTGGGGMTLHLFTNDVTPTDASVVSDFFEANAVGYAAQPLVYGAWVVYNDAGIATSKSTARAFTFGGELVGATHIYGSYILNAQGLLVGAGKLTTPQAITTEGAVVSVTPKIRMSKGTVL